MKATGAILVFTVMLVSGILLDQHFIHKRDAFCGQKIEGATITYCALYADEYLLSNGKYKGFALYGTFHGKPYRVRFHF